MDTLEAGIDLNATISGHTPFHITIPIFISTFASSAGQRLCRAAMLCGGSHPLVKKMEKSIIWMLEFPRGACWHVLTASRSKNSERY